MEYLDKENQILKYLAKIKDTGKITVAHLKCLKPVGKDYEVLSDIQKKRLEGEDISEVIAWTDAEVDEEKLKALFEERNMMTKTEFKTLKTKLVTDDKIAVDFTATAKGTQEHKTLEEAYKVAHPVEELIINKEEEI